MGLTILSYISWITYILIESFRESNFKNLKNISNIEVNIPKLCYIQRSLFLFILWVFLFSNISWWSFGIIISLILITPLIHNSSYFYLRNKLNPDIFKDKTCQDTDIEEEKPSIYLNHKWRKVLAITGLILQLFICFLR
jgi:hypothetical protein